MPISAAATAIRATLLNVGKRSFQRRMALIGWELESEHVVIRSCVTST